ncbi:retrovirus-related Pol polyprotein from transposon 412 [Trichonephila clavipes]|nr:retrovirus-related Pol polyprotein from transposon 412 [Trichonephila clavipes]
MAQYQNQRRRRITRWECGEPRHLRSNCFRNNKEDRRTKCWGQRKGPTDENVDVPSRKPCPENSKYISRFEKKFGVIDPVIRQFTTLSTFESDLRKSIRKDQLADPKIKPVIEFKESNDENPSWQDIALFHPITKHYRALWVSLRLRNGVLYRKWKSDDEKTFRWQLILSN